MLSQSVARAIARRVRRQVCWARYNLLWIWQGELMRDLCLTIVLMITSATFAADPVNPLSKPAPAPLGTMKFTRLAVKDPGINNIEAISFLIPAGWKTEGGIQWFPDYSILANLLMKVSDPQSGATVEFLPLQNCTWLNQPVMPMQPGTNYMGNIIYEPVKDIPQFIQLFYMPKTLAHLQNGRAVSKEDLTKVADQVKAMWGGQPDVKSARVRYEYINGGKQWEEDVYVTLVYTSSQLVVYSA
jgi:hypothetical protein